MLMMHEIDEVKSCS